jgi:penicillin-binding protein 2
VRNRPCNDLAIPAPDAGPRLDHAPHLRLLVLFVAVTLPVGVIGGRLAYLQVALIDRFTADWDRTREVEDVVPARAGRILTADGRILAYDEPQFDLAVHYRWLEEPVNDVWLTQQARTKLKPRDRRDTDKLAAARAVVLEEREALWSALVAETGTSREDYRTRCRQTQTRVERVYEYVSRLQQQRESHVQSFISNTPDQTFWERGWNAFVSELTTPPEREAREPLVVKEQLDYHVVAERVSLDTVAAVESLPSRFPGVEIRQSSDRIYPAGALAAHIVGVRTSLTGDEFRERQARYPEGDPLGYRVGDRIGRSGIERSSDSRLHGRAGLKRTVRDRHGVVLNTEIVRPPVNGSDVILTFDSRLQAQTEALLDDVIGPAAGTKPGADSGSIDPLDVPPASTRPNGGCLVALDVRTGRVLAAAAAPRFELNLLADYDETEWNRTLADERQPFFPRVTQMTVPPGSVFKVLTSVALLESGLIDPDVHYHCQGYLDRPDRDRCLIYRHYGVGHGDMNLESALCQSCNVYFFNAARRIGPQSIHDWAARFGLGDVTGVDVPGEQRGHLPSPDPSSPDGPWYPGTTLQFAIGQASLTVTPLQVARMMAAVANDGYLVTPRFVNESPTPEPSSERRDILLAAFEESREMTPQRIPGLSSGTLQRIRAGLRQVVEHPKGTGKRVRLDEISIAGKTGTAEVGGGQTDHAWFAGYAPADAPRVAFVVVLENGGSGGHDAGPIARKFVQSLLDFGVLEPDRSAAN